MGDTKVTDRLTFLAESFDIFENEFIDIKLKSLVSDGYEALPIYANKSKKKLVEEADVIGILSVKRNEKDRELKKVSISSHVFTLMVLADPTDNKMYLQWMLNLFSSLIKENSISSAIRLVNEDLPQAKLYLGLFEDNKRKNKFKVLCKSTYGLKHIEDPTNINQYKTLSQLFDAVDPFIEKEPSAVERTMSKYVESGQALIPVKDRHFTLYIPKTTEASVVFDKFASWCTARKDNGMFESYTNGNKKPNGKNSDIYIIIDNKFFTGESKDLFQIHFETDQIKDRNNSQTVSIFETVLMKSPSLSSFFKEELMGMAKEYKKGIDNNKYLNYLIKFGFAESLFELIENDTPAIRYMRKEIPRLPDISRFKKLDQLIITNAGLVDIHPSIGTLLGLDMLVLVNNRITSLPKEIGNLKNMTFLNLTGNKITHFPEEIKYLDKSNGGSLFRLGVDIEEIGEENYHRLKLLLPTTSIGNAEGSK
jgi:hypothetical protein